MLNDKDLKRIQRCELIIADEIKRLCKKNGIPYFMVGGTLLGAIRHKGFIPWDDDMDFAVPSDYYGRFIDVCKTDLSDRFEFQDWDSDKDYPYPFAKIRLRSTLIEESFDSEKNKKKGVFVDVFSLVRLRNDESFCIKADKQNAFFTRTLWIKKGYGKNIKQDGIVKRLKYDVFRFVSLFYNYEKTKKRYKDFIENLGDSNSSKRLMLCSSYSFDRLVIQSEWIENVATYQFEDRTFPGFRDYDKYLTVMYGDYMTLPEEKDRHTHSIRRVNFGEYVEILETCLD